MQQLSGQDASFIYAERPHAPTHITSIGIYDQSTAPGGDGDVQGDPRPPRARLHLARAFRQKAVRVPGDLDHPWWVEDGDFDLEYHVRHIALPAPGDWRQFCIQAARLHARPLDLSRPLWEMYVIEGLDDVEGVPKGALRHRAQGPPRRRRRQVRRGDDHGHPHPDPDGGDPPPPATPWQPEHDPSAAELSTRAGVNAVTDPGPGAAPGRPARPGPRAGGRRAAAPAAAELDRSWRRAPGSTGPSPPTACSTPASSSFADLKPMRDAVPGATVNDVALAVLGGALRSYLDDAGELPEASLRAMTPVSVRTEAEKADLGNQVSAMIVSLATDVADPVERLAAVARARRRRRRSSPRRSARAT